MALSALQILNSYIRFEVSHGPSDMASMQLSKSRITDGEWHHLLIELRSAKEGKDIKYLAVMTLDYGMDQVSICLYPPWDNPFIGPWKSTMAVCQDLQGPCEFGMVLVSIPVFGVPVPCMMRRRLLKPRVGLCLPGSPIMVLGIPL